VAGVEKEPKSEFICLICTVFGRDNDKTHTHQLRHHLFGPPALITSPAPLIHLAFGLFLLEIQEKRLKG
jgi:hypothetical protein